MHFHPRHSATKRWPLLAWMACTGLLAAPTAPTPADLPTPDAGLRPKPEAASPARPAPLPTPAPAATLPEELILIPPLSRPRDSRPRPGVTRPAPPPGSAPAPFPPAITLLPRTPVAAAGPLLPLLPIAPGFALPLLEPAAATNSLLIERFAVPRQTSARLNARERTPAVPLGLQRHPGRDASADTDGPTYTFLVPESEVHAELSFGLQNQVRYSNNIDGTSPKSAREDTVVETTPQIRLLLGSAPGPRAVRDFESEYYLQLEYAPTVRNLLGAGTERMLQRVRGEAGRATPINTAALRFEYDENLFALGGLDSPEDSYTLFELAPRLEYRPSERSLLYARGTYDRIRVGNSTTDRSDYVLDVGLGWDYSVKTRFGAGVELRHIVFDTDDLGEVDYQFGYLAFNWRATAKLLFQAQGGVEVRQEHRDVPGAGDKAEAAGTALLNWAPDDATSITAGFRVRNQPSVTGQGELYRDMRIGLDFERDLTHHFYGRGELVFRQRDYETGRREAEWTVRPALGYRAEGGRVMRALSVEIFYQHRILDSNVPGSDFTQEMVGLQTLISF